MGREQGQGPLIPWTTKNQESPAEEREGGGMGLFGVGVGAKVQGNKEDGRF